MRECHEGEHHVGLRVHLTSMMESSAAVSCCIKFWVMRTWRNIVCKDSSSIVHERKSQKDTGNVVTVKVITWWQIKVGPPGLKGGRGYGAKIWIWNTSDCVVCVCVLRWFQIHDVMSTTCIEIPRIMNHVTWHGWITRPCFTWSYDTKGYHEHRFTKWCKEIKWSDHSQRSLRQHVNK